jgi:hypothetical protein
MIANGKLIGRLIVGCVFACCLTQNINAQLLPPGGGGSGGGGGEYTNSYSSFVVNTNFLISLQNTNIVLNWRSATNKIFLLENRATLDGGTTWRELTNYYLSAANTNWTKFVHTNIVQTQPTGFYRLFDVTPIATPDFFAVDQDSSANQLNILQNDIVPNDDLIIITNLISAQHGSISYTPDASTFEYTPDLGFYGVDTFAYSITSKHGEISSNALVKVFVNQSGNNPPSVPEIVITLQTNVHTVSFNALTNATDSDGDTNILFAVNAPRLGSVSNAANGNITYTRNPSLFGGDAFTYVVTDGHGGYGLGNVKILQVDSDGDGMPDEWEMANGLDPFNDDSTDDPDSDALPNLAEFQLGANPHFSDNPLNFQTITNGFVLRGFAHLPLSGIHPNQSSIPLVLYVNGQPAANASFSQAADGQWNINWDTTFLTNGVYQIQAGLQYKNFAPVGFQTVVLGQAKSVQINNLMTFDSLTAKFTDFLLINATFAISNATYDVYLYDDDGNPLVYATDLTTTNSKISLYWDLTDGNGNQISTGNVRAFFYLHSQQSSAGVHLLSSSLTPIPPQWFLKETGNSGNIFAVAWGWDAYSTSFNNRRTSLMLNGVINFLGDPSDPNSYNLRPLDNVAYANTFRYDNNSDKATLISALQSSYNFFWFGHGSFSSISGNQSHSAITPGEVATALDNHSSISTPTHPKTDKHPYRLVILNACETYSQLWSGAFGIDFSASGSPYTTAYYLYAGRSPRAFVGWVDQIDVPDYPSWYQSDVSPEYTEALAQLYYNWMAGNYLAYSLNQFATKAAQHGFSNANTFKISGCVDLTR